MKWRYNRYTVNPVIESEYPEIADRMRARRAMWELGRLVWLLVLCALPICALVTIVTVAAATLPLP